jgi:glycosyltransferase involved in cell wall biosynthesis
MKLLIITDAWHPQVNGVVRTYEHLGEELVKMGHTVHVIGPANFPFKIPMPGYAEIELALFPYCRLAKLIEEYNPDTIHISTEGPLGWAGRRYCLKNKIPYTTTYHTQFPDYVAKRLTRFIPPLYNTVNKMGRWVVKTFHAHSHAMFVATQSLEDELKSWGFKTPMRRLTRGARLEQFFPGPKTVMQNLPRPIALYVGRVAIEKSIEDFLAMKWEGSKVVVGEGPSTAELQRQYKDAHFLGKKTGKELADYYRSADVFVFPSRTDTFGMVIVEALACGIPVAGYNVTGPRDIITEDFLGAVHNTDLAAAACKALAAPGTPEQRARHVKESFTWETAARQFEQALLRKR